MNDYEYNDREQYEGLRENDMNDMRDEENEEEQRVSD